MKEVDSSMKKVYKFILSSLAVMALMLCGASGNDQSEAIVLGAGQNQISISSTKETMYVGEKLTLSLDGCKGKVVWASSKSALAKVSKNGVITACKAGTAVITAIYDGEAYTCKITVKNPYIKETKKTLEVEDVYRVKVVGTKAVSYTSSRTKVAKVSSNGKVTALAEGTSTISVKCENGKTYKCKIVVQSNDELTAKELYSKCCDSVVEIGAGDSLGSGFFISKNRVVTNYHVIEKATKLEMKLLDGTTYDVLQVLGYDEALDLAVLEVDYQGIPMAYNSHGVTMGETTYTIGSSLGLTNTFSNGMVTNTKREFDGVIYIQTNTAISPGNSGGPLINAYGEVMGVTTSTFTEGQNLNLVINISQLKQVDTKNPMSVKEFINRKSQKNTSQPNFTGFVYYGEEFDITRVCVVTITNNGNKKLVVGGKGYADCLLVYPYEDATYSYGYLVDDNSNKVDSVTIKAGETKQLGIVMEYERCFWEGAKVGFICSYDGVEYVAIVTDGGYVYWEVFEE